jgi:hypothetical protein
MSALQTRYDTLLDEAKESDLRIEVYNFSHDNCGNPTAHYNVYKRSGGGSEYTKQRKQIGYSGDCLQGASSLLSKLSVSLSEYNQVLQIGSRSDGSITLYFNKNPA